MAYDEPPTAPGACCDTAPCTCQEQVWTEGEVRAAVASALNPAPRYGGPQHNNPGALKLTATPAEARAHRQTQLIEDIVAALKDGT